MKIRTLTLDDLVIYRNDIYQCYQDNPQIIDFQSPLYQNFEGIEDMLVSYVQSVQCYIDGIFDNDENYLYGFVIYESIRLTDDGNTAQLHIAISKDMWGKDFYPIYKRMIEDNIFNVLYAIIPACCRGAIGLCKRMGFKKTGYIPKTTPYKTLKGETKMFDEFIYVLQKENNFGKIPSYKDNS